MMTARIPGVGLIVAFVIVLSCLSSVTAQPFYEAYYLYLDNYPAYRNNGWHVNAQGVAHDQDHWFVTQTETIWRIPVTYDLNADVSGSTLGVTRRTFDDYPALSDYNHFGDLVYYEYQGQGYLLVPIENTSNVPMPAIAIFRPDSLTYVDHAVVSGQAKCGWCAVDPAGFVYTSESHTTELRKYNVNWADLNANDPLVISYDFAIPILNESGEALQLRHMQGGEFTPSGELLYLVTGFWTDTDPIAEGIHVLDTNSWRRVQHSTNGYGYFNYEFHPGPNPGGSSDEEPEGLTIWDLENDGRVPQTVRGQLHVLMLDNDDFPDGDDDINFKHYSGAICADGAYVGEELGTPTKPFNTVTEANNLAWNGARIRIKAGFYPETLMFSRKLRVSTAGGLVRIGP
jgi:hypothetical protein